MVIEMESVDVSSKVNEDERIAIKNVSDSLRGFQHGGKTIMVGKDEGILVTRKEYERIYKNSRTPNGDSVWKVISIDQLKKPNMYQLKDIQQDNEVNVDDRFIKSMKSIITGSLDDIRDYLSVCKSVTTLQNLLTEIDNASEIDGEKISSIKSLIVKRIAAIDKE